ncbi:hypothetical protein DDE18_09440 [Nocardioides gansuensis]|uniref:Uncharacterized protein n=1 Tax=Nocardioides gansuensis TaxID=2138300 RepID=A0A2T8FCP8_9ACTN|nr:hypothetical protein [Nocardioides gansuensis]PVG83487.1 hypothetical protein DDE18_09440 [Nocardioides gansuensis]
MTKIRIDLYLDKSKTPETGVYDLSAVPRKGEEVEIDRFAVTGLVMGVLWTPDSERQEVVVTVYAETGDRVAGG